MTLSRTDLDCLGKGPFCPNKNIFCLKQPTRTGKDLQICRQGSSDIARRGYDRNVTSACVTVDKLNKVWVRFKSCSLIATVSSNGKDKKDQEPACLCFFEKRKYLDIAALLSNMYILGELNRFPSLQTVYETNSIVRANSHLTMMNLDHR